MFVVVLYSAKVQQQAGENNFTAAYYTKRKD